MGGGCGAGSMLKIMFAAAENGLGKIIVTEKSKSGCHLR